jgi:hypothetical protein
MRYAIMFAVALAACSDQGASAPIVVNTPAFCDFTPINGYDEPVDVAGGRSVHDVVSDAAALYASVHGVVHKRPQEDVEGTLAPTTEPGPSLTFSMGIAFGDIVSAKAVDDPYCQTSSPRLEVTVMASSTGDFVTGPLEAIIFANDQGMTQVRFGAPGVPVGPIADAIEADALSEVSAFGILEGGEHLLEGGEHQWGTWAGPRVYVSYSFVIPYHTASGLIVTSGGTKGYAWCDWPDTCLTADGVVAPWETTP